MGKIRVLHLIESLSRGGAERRLINDLTFLDNNVFGHSVCTIFDRTDLKEEIAKLGIPIHGLRAKRGIDPLALLRLMKLVKDNRFDIIHTQLFWADLYGRLIKCFTRRVSLVTTVQSSVYEPSNPYLYARKRKLVDSVMGRLFTDRFIAVSQFVKKSIIRRLAINEDKIEIIHNTVDLQKFEPEEKTDLKNRLGLKEKQIVLLTVGRLNPPKGHTFLIRALDQIKETLPDFILLVVGDGPFRNQLQQLSRSLGLEERIRFLGERNDVKELLLISDIFILPTLSEGLSVSLLEAMLTRRLCLASDIEPNKEIIEDGKDGLLFKPHDSQSLAKALLRAIRLPDKGASLAYAGYLKVINSFSAKEAALQLKQIYSELYYREANIVR